MKTYEYVSKNGMKLFKGLFAIFMIKLILLGGALIVQSCSNEDVFFDNQEKKLALEEFESIVKKNLHDIQIIVDKNPKVEKVGKSSNSENDNIQSARAAQEALMPLVEGSINLLDAYGVNEADFEVGVNMNDPSIALIGMAILAGEINDEELAQNLISIIATPVYASDWGECAIHASGIGAIAELARGNLSKRALKKAVRKVLSRTLGWVGAAWAAYEFGDCIGWW